jgi:3-hydroxybutyryl-CoA dehydrogenase
LASVAVIFEAVPEVLDLKRDASARASVLAGPKPIIASTTSTIMVDEMAGEVERTARFPRRPLAQSSLSRPAS